MPDPNMEELEEAISRIWEIAREMGLDPFPTHFEMVPATIMYEFGAYGLPGRFSHWTHGKSYHQMRTMYDYGLSKIYELVVNTDPCYAFLLEHNSVLQNKLVVAHVLAHCDFFKNNAYFAHTSRKMIEAVSNNAGRIRQYEFRHGGDVVEKFLDAVISIEEHIDPNVRVKHSDPDVKPSERHTAYDDLFDLDGRLEQKAPAPPVSKTKKIPPEPEKDILGFLAAYGPELEDWQRDILQIVREEMLYFVPQMQTKIMNEGWASFWHARIMRELDLSSAEFANFAAMHSSVLSPGSRSINPYYIGMKMFEDIERRWDDPTQEEQDTLGRKPGKGREKIFEVRQNDNDVSFLRNYLTKDLVEDLDLYLYEQQGDKLVIVEKDWEKVRNQIVASMTNFGQPYIVVEDGDYHRSRELYLRHCYEGQELDPGYTEKTLRYVYQIWARPVHLETIVEGKQVIFSYDGEKNIKVDTAAA